MEDTKDRSEEDRRKKRRHDPFGMFTDFGALIPDIGFGSDFSALDTPFGAGFGPLSPPAPAGPTSQAPPAAPGRPTSPSAGSAGGAARAEGGAGRPRATGERKESSLGRAALDVALSEESRGVREEPPGSNDGPRVRMYQRGNGGHYWCAHFVSWCVNEAGDSPFGHTGSVSAIRRWGQNNGHYIPASRAHPMPGDIFTKQRVDEQGRVVGGHTGFVISYDEGARRMRTVEGNSGDRVRITSQRLSQIDGVVRL